MTDEHAGAADADVDEGDGDERGNPSATADVADGDAADAPPLTDEALPEGWRVWTDGADGRAIVVFRPDVFDADRFPAPCLPTLYLTNGSRRARPGAGQRRTDEWHVTLFLEPEVEAESRTFDDRAAALAGVHDAAARFAAGEIDYRGAYQVPREEYLDELDELVRGE